MRRPSTVTVPFSGATRPTKLRISVVLPAPLGPRRPYTSPRRTRKLTPSRAVCLPNRLTTPSTSTAYVSVATNRGLRSHAAQPDMGELEDDVFAGGNVDRCPAHHRRGGPDQHYPPPAPPHPP